MGFAMYGMAVVLAPAIGPTLGGYLTDNYSWHWIFFINVPIGILSLYLTSRMVEDPPWIDDARERAKHSPVDYLGLSLIAVGSRSLAGRARQRPARRLVLLPLHPDFYRHRRCRMLGFVIWEWREQHPILNLRLLKSQLRGQQYTHVHPRFCALRNHRPDPAVSCKP